MRARRSPRLALATTFALAALLARSGVHTSLLALKAAAPAATQVSSIRVHLVDYEKAAPAELEEAQSEASRLWRAIDVRLEWASGEAPRDAPPPVGAIPALDVTTILLPKDMAQRMIAAEHRGDGVLGRAVPEALRAYIFYDRVMNTSRQLNAPRALVLGRVIAHELAHLLLGHTHSYRGLFRAEPDLGSARVTFDPDDGARIRIALASTSAASLVAPPTPAAVNAAAIDHLVERLRDLAAELPGSAQPSGAMPPIDQARWDLYRDLHVAGARAYPALARGLRDADVRERRSVALFLTIEALPTRGVQPAALTPLLPALVSALTDEDRQVTWWSAHVLGMMGGAAAPAVSGLVDMLRHGRDEESRVTAATSLATIGSADALPALHGALQDPDSDVRVAAQLAIANIRRASVK